MEDSWWATCGDLRRMLAHLPEEASPRKLRLFACACCRAVWALLGDPRSRQAVETAERFADGLVGLDALAGAARLARAAQRQGRGARAGPAALGAHAAAAPDGWAAAASWAFGAFAAEALSARRAPPRSGWR